MDGNQSDSLQGFKQLHDDIVHLWQAIYDWLQLLDTVERDHQRGGTLTFGRLAELLPSLEGKSIREIASVGASDFHRSLVERIKAYDYELDLAHRAVAGKDYDQSDIIAAGHASGHEMAVYQGHNILSIGMRAFLKVDCYVGESETPIGPPIHWFALPADIINEELRLLTAEAMDDGLNEIGDRSEWLDYYFFFKDLLRAEKNRALEAAGAPLFSRSLHNKEGGTPEATVNDDADTLPEWAIDLPRIRGKLVRYLWGQRKMTASFDDLYNNVWEDPVEDGAIKQMVKNTNELIIDHGYTLSISNRRVRLKTIQ